MTALILRPASFNELAQFATMAAKSSMVPPGFRGKPEDIMLAVQMGSEVGLSPMQALQNIAVINNRPSLWGDAMLGLCRAAAVCEDIAERIEGEGDSMTALCLAKRRGSSPVMARFSVADAKKAGLWGKAGPWQQYPQRMLQMRARGFALRDAFPDVLRGLIIAEEAQDAPPVVHPGPTIDASPADPPPIPQPPPAERGKAEQRADAIAARFAAVVTEGDYYEALDADGEALKWLYSRRPDLWTAPEAARVAASQRMTPAPGAEVPA
jgi:hypothetical protein